MRSFLTYVFVAQNNKLTSMQVNKLSNIISAGGSLLLGIYFLEVIKARPFFFGIILIS